MIPSTALHFLFALEAAAMAKAPMKTQKGIPIGGHFRMTDGKLERTPTPPRMSVSAKIAKRKKPSQKYTKAQRP